MRVNKTYHFIRRTTSVIFINDSLFRTDSIVFNRSSIDIKLQTGRRPRIVEFEIRFLLLLNICTPPAFESSGCEPEERIGPTDTKVRAINFSHEPTKRDTNNRRSGSSSSSSSSISVNISRWANWFGIKTFLNKIGNKNIEDNGANRIIKWNEMDVNEGSDRIAGYYLFFILLLLLLLSLLLLLLRDCCLSASERMLFL